MPTITVKYLMIFSQATGKMKETFTVDEGATINDLLEILFNKYGRKFRKLIQQDLENRSVIFAIDGEAKDVSTVLSDGDEVLISYPVGGG